MQSGNPKPPASVRYTVGTCSWAGLGAMLVVLGLFSYMLAAMLSDAGNITLEDRASARLAGSTLEEFGAAAAPPADTACVPRVVICLETAAVLGTSFDLRGCDARLDRVGLLEPALARACPGERTDAGTVAATGMGFRRTPSAGVFTRVWDEATKSAFRTTTLLEYSAPWLRQGAEDLCGALPRCVRAVLASVPDQPLGTLRAGAATLAVIPRSMPPAAAAAVEGEVWDLHAGIKRVTTLLGDLYARARPVADLLNELSETPARRAVPVLGIGVLPEEGLEGPTPSATDRPFATGWAVDAIPEMVKFGAGAERAAPWDAFPETVPRSFSWASDACMGAPREQGRCGACVFFTLAEFVRFDMCRTHNIEITPSVECVLACDAVGRSCRGTGFASAVAAAYAEGFAEESCDPYTSKSGARPHPCHALGCPAVAAVAEPEPIAVCVDASGRPAPSGFCHKQRTTAIARRAIVHHGPLVAGIILSDGLLDWIRAPATAAKCDLEHGAFDPLRDSTRGYAGHAMLIVGYYVRASDGRTVWIYKNWWGPNTGCNGMVHVVEGSDGLATEKYLFMLHAVPPTSR